MANFQQSGINFTIENNFTGSERKHVIKGKLTSVVNDYKGYEQDDASKLINAVEFDWNGAQVNGAIINTIGDLLSKIATFEVLIA